MNYSAAIFFCTLMLGGCQDESRSATDRVQSLPPVDPVKLLTRPFRDVDLELTVWHYVVSPQEIRGVISVRNVATEPVALIDRWNSMGSEQWHVVVDGRDVFSNPQHEWEKNGYTESTIDGNSIRAISFVLHAQRTPAEKYWEFTPKDAPFPGWIDASTGEFHPINEKPNVQIGRAHV